MKPYIYNSGNTGQRGQALVELGAVIPLVFLLIVLTMNFAGLINAWISVANAARAAANYAILSGSSAGLPTQATSASLQSLITADLSALPNYTTAVKACVRTNNNSTIAIVTNMNSGCTGATNPPLDAEVIATGSTIHFESVAVDVTYTYTPFFVGSTFWKYALPNILTNVHQRWVMRVL